MVLPTGVAVFEPFEIITLREEGTDRLVYGGHAIGWRTNEAARELMREHTRTAGQALAESTGYWASTASTESWATRVSSPPSSTPGTSPG